MDGENKGKKPIRIDDLEPDGIPSVYKWLAINWMMNQIYIGNGWKSPFPSI